MITTPSTQTMVGQDLSTSNCVESTCATFSEKLGVLIGRLSQLASERWAQAVAEYYRILELEDAIRNADISYAPVTTAELMLAALLIPQNTNQVLRLASGVNRFEVQEKGQEKGNVKPIYHFHSSLAHPAQAHTTPGVNGQPAAIQVIAHADYLECAAQGAAKACFYYTNDRITLGNHTYLVKMIPNEYRTAFLIRKGVEKQ